MTNPEEFTNDEVTVKGKDGGFYTVPKSGLSYALTQGYVVPPNHEIQHQIDLEKAGEGINPLIAGAESAGSAATFGLSREAENALGVTTPEAQALRQEANPVASGIGTAAGIAVPLLASGFGAAPVIAGGEAANVARAGLGAADLLNPIGAVSKIGSATSKAVEPMAQGALAGLVETSPRLANAITKGVSSGVGGAAEGVAFGLGQSIDEHALGDPDALGEHLLSNVGINALLGGTLGSAIGIAHPVYEAGTGAIKKSFEPVFERINKLLPWQKEAVAAGDAAETMRISDFPEADKFINKLKDFRRIENEAPLTQGSAQRLGLPVFPEQTTDDIIIKRGADWLVQGQPTLSSLEFRRQRVDAMRALQDKLSSNLATQSMGVSELEAGQKFASSLGSEIEAQSKPLNDAYDIISSYGEAIPLSDRSKQAISRNFLKNKEIRLNLKGAEGAYSKEAADAILNARDINDIRTIRTSFQKRLGLLSPGEERNIVGAISERLTNLEENVIKRFAKSDMKSPEAKDKILGLLDHMKETKAKYAEFAKNISELGGGLGKSNLRGSKTAQLFLDQVNPQSLIKKSFNKNNVEFTQFLKNKFPTQFEQIRDYKIAQIKEKALEAKNPIGQMIKEFDSMPKEIQDLLFSEQQKQVFSDAKQWISKFPDRMNPSSTAYTNAFADAFSSPQKTIIANLRDYGISKYIDGSAKKVEGMSTPEANRISNFARLKKIADKTQAAIETSAKAVFSDTGKTAIIGTASGLFHDEDKKSMSKIDEITSDPEKMMNALHNSTKDTYQYIPLASAGVQKSMINAAKFLSTKMPRPTNQKILSSPYKPSKSQTIKFNGYFNTIKNPTHVMRGIKFGMVTSEQMEALKAVYPQMLTQMQMAVMEQMSDHISEDKDLSYSTKIGLSQFLEKDLINSMSQQSIAMNQMSTQGEMKSDEDGMMNPTQQGLSSITASDQVSTNLQKISKGEDV